METVFQLQPVLELTDEQFYELCVLNRDVRLERNAGGELVIMPPTGGETGDRNAEITMQLRLWSKKDSTGTSFDSSTGFRLPNGAIRSPDAAWVSRARLDLLSDEQQKTFIALGPDFLIELRPPNDRLALLQDKMLEYRDNGVRLAWLIDPEQHKVSIYRPDLPVEDLEGPARMHGDPVLPGFVLDLDEIW